MRTIAGGRRRRLPPPQWSKCGGWGRLSWRTHETSVCLRRAFNAKQRPLARGGPGCARRLRGLPTGKVSAFDGVVAVHGVRSWEISKQARPGRMQVVPGGEVLTWARARLVPALERWLMQTLSHWPVEPFGVGRMHRVLPRKVFRKS